MTGGAFAADTVATSQQNGTQDDALVFENNTIEIDLSADGDARWTVSWAFSIPEADGNDQFQQLASEFENGGEGDYLETLESLRNASQRLDAERDRRIRITNESWETSRTGTGENATGRLSLSFTWENFARVDGDRLIVDDVLATAEHGVWLEGLTADQKLIIRIPPSYGVIDANVDVQNQALRWQGPTAFDDTTLQATLIGNRMTPSPTPSPSEGTPVLLWGLGGFLALAAVVGAFLLYRSGGLPTPAEPDDGDQPAGGDGPGVDGDAPAEPATTTDEEPASGGTTEIQEELLSDEERVERLLEANGGRMKQADIVEETDWSNAKVSQLLSSMEDEDRIDKLRIGRENLISFPDVDVTEIRNDE